MLLDVSSQLLWVTCRLNRGSPYDVNLESQFAESFIAVRIPLITFIANGSFSSSDRALRFYLPTSKQTFCKLFERSGSLFGATGWDDRLSGDHESTGPERGLAQFLRNCHDDLLNPGKLSPPYQPVNSIRCRSPIQETFRFPSSGPQ
jgi:hypothetical protein